MRLSSDQVPELSGAVFVNGFGIIGVTYTKYDELLPRAVMATSIDDVKKCIMRNKIFLKRTAYFPDLSIKHNMLIIIADLKYVLIRTAVIRFVLGTVINNYLDILFIMYT